MKYQVTEQANGKFSVFSDSGDDVSMADEELVAYDMEQEAAEQLAKELSSA